MSTTPPAVNRRPSDLAAAMLDVAISRLGVRETKNKPNHGPEVKQYLKAVGLPEGFAWCMAFVVHSCDTAVAILKKRDNVDFRELINPLVRTGGVLAQFNNAKGPFVQKLDRRKDEISADTVRPGDIFIMDYGGGRGHTGIIKRVAGTSVVAIEGNTNAAGSREGDGVYEKRREISGFRGIIRIID